MKRYIENIRVSLAAILASLIVWYLLFKENLAKTGAILTDGSGDGYKNFFTFGYQYLYGQGLHFTGMLHPYGDLAIYADAQPLIVWLLQFFKWLGISSENYLLAVFNFLPIAALGLCFVFLYKIFRHYKIPVALALGFSFVCICLSPQLYRYQSHNSLSYTFIIPFYWWAMIVTRDRIKIVFTVFATLFSVLLGFIHPYYIPILSIFGTASLLARLRFFEK